MTELKTKPPATWEWTEQRERAALLLALDELTEVQIANDIGCSRDTIWWWKQHPVFVSRIQETAESIRSRILEEGISVKANRLKELNDRHRRLRQVIAERAAYFATHDDTSVRMAPGGQTGLLVRQVKIIGSGRSAKEVEEYVVDTALLREMRSIEEHAARETGQWTDKTELTLTKKLYIGIDIDAI